MNKLFICWFIALCAISNLHAQKFTKQDTLRGSITPERAWWKLQHYNLDIKVNPETKTISGNNIISYTVLKPYQVMQIDLQEPMQITKALQNGKELDIRHDGNAHFITLDETQKKGQKRDIQVFYTGKPRQARNAPWDGGISWKKDENGKHFIASSCQGLGASVWWPNKDHMYEEATLDLHVNVPNTLMNVSNGRLIEITPQKDDTTTYHWQVVNPINNYGVNINIGDYVHFSEVYDGEKGKLDMNYYVLRDNLEKAKVQFKDAPKMMKAFEHWFGPYPFYEDGYKLVEVPYLGMEHQSSVTYGNDYKNGYLGDDLSGTGLGLKFDFIIIHESGHEWFANNITYKDIADMWIHESFTAYSENLFLDYYYGKEASAQYVLGTKKRIRNDRPIIGTYNVNHQGSGDMYYKGANMLHTIRQLINDDDKWRNILRGLNKTFYHKTVTSQEIEDYINKATSVDLKPIFDQYLRTTKVPVLSYQINGKNLNYSYENVVENFSMPLEISINGNVIKINPTDKLKVLNMNFTIENVAIDSDYYVLAKIINK